MSLIKMECDHCGGSLEMDIENLQAYCPYCGNKLTIDIEHLSKILESVQQTKREQIREEEQTKRTEMAYNFKAKENKSWNRTVIIVMVLFVIFFISMLIFAKITTDSFFN